MDGIEISNEASPEDKEAVFSWLREFNHSENGPFMQSLEAGAERALFLVARDVSGKAIGGLQGTLLHRWLKIDLMAVSPGNRSKGIGRRLVAEAERMGTVEGCEYAYVDTMSYQAPDFYHQLGYQEVGRLPDWDSHGHDKTFFIKDLAEPGES